MSAAPLLWGVLFSSIGLGYFLHGRKQRAPIENSAAIVAIGLGLMAVPYFV